MSGGAAPRRTGVRSRPVGRRRCGRWRSVADGAAIGGTVGGGATSSGHGGRTVRDAAVRVGACPAGGPGRVRVGWAGAAPGPGAWRSPRPERGPGRGPASSTGVREAGGTRSGVRGVRRPDVPSTGRAPGRRAAVAAGDPLRGAANDGAMGWADGAPGGGCAAVPVERVPAGRSRSGRRPGRSTPTAPWRRLRFGLRRYRTSRRTAAEHDDDADEDHLGPAASRQRSDRSGSRLPATTLHAVQLYRPRCIATGTTVAARVASRRRSAASVAGSGAAAPGVAAVRSGRRPAGPVRPRSTWPGGGGR